VHLRVISILYRESGYWRRRIYKGVTSLKFLLLLPSVFPNIQLFNYLSKPSYPVYILSVTYIKRSIFHLNPTAISQNKKMAGYIKNVSLPIQLFSDAQASILDFLFPGFTRMSTTVQWYLTIDLNIYIPLLYFFGLIVFTYRGICKYF
jgi:hypothetical protein